MQIPECIAGYKTDTIFKPKEDMPNRSITMLCDGDIEVATVKWNHDDRYFWVIEISVRPEYRRKGIATTIYYTLAEITGLNLKWCPNAWASNEMRALAKKILSLHISQPINEDCFEVRLNNR